jgi:hypothetical protein
MTIHGFFPVFSGYLPDLSISAITDEAAVTIDSSAVIDWCHTTHSISIMQSVAFNRELVC